MDSRVGYFGIEKRTCLKTLGKKEVKRIETLKRWVGIVKKLVVFRKQYLRSGTNKLINMDLVLSRCWEQKALGICPRQRLRIRRQVAEVLGKKKQTL